MSHRGHLGARRPGRPLMIAALYLALGSAWIVASDALIQRIFGGETQLALHIAKDLAFVVVTAGGLYLILRWYRLDVAASETRYRRLVESAHNAMLVTDLDGRCRIWNRAARELSGYGDDELDAMRIENLVATGRHEIVREGRAAGERAGAAPPVFAAELRRSDGERVPVLVSVSLVQADAAPATLLVELVDLREERALRQQLLIAQRAEAAGTLAAGVAHDFNNLLTAIHSGLEMARLQPDRAGEWLDRASTAADRASALVRRLLYARQPPTERTPTHLDELVRETVGLVAEMIEERTRVDVAADTGLPPVPVDRVQMQQVLMNLLLNAFDSIRQRREQEQAGGREGLVRVEVRPEDGEAVLVDVIDNGAGIPDDVRERIFDPFFTTKPPGSGTGLGLATSYAIVTAHGGTITVQSTPGEGSRFEVRLPLRTGNGKASSRRMDAPSGRS